ncbi:MAG: hypothetical protein WCJ95_03845 [Mariniphaga sp.]
MQTILGKDSTTRLSCRTGDYLLWCSFKGIFSPPNNQYDINDIWQLSDGDSVLITNRQVDLPSWFELYPNEVAGKLVLWMQNKLSSGFKPDEIIYAANIWRSFSGDRLVWVGKERPGTESKNGVLAVFTFTENMAIIGQSKSDVDDFSQFGGFDQNNQSAEELALCQKGWTAAVSLESPRSAAADDKWTISY